MTTLDDVRTALGPLLDDVRRTTGIDLVVEPASLPDLEDYWLVYERGAPPQGPLTLKGDRPNHDFALVRYCPGVDPADDLGLDLLVWEVQELVQMKRWARGEDPTWPPCPVDPTHYLDVHALQRWEARGQRMVRTLVWDCDRHGTPLGKLSPS